MLSGSVVTWACERTGGDSVGWVLASPLPLLPQLPGKSGAGAPVRGVGCGLDLEAIFPSSTSSASFTDASDPRWCLSGGGRMDVE